jgi:hypothetical protein
VPLRCSCGAILPEDARFCHKCGKPQYEEDIARMNAAEAPSPAPAAAPVLQIHPPSKIGFGNGRAVRITLAVAGFSLLALSVIANIAPPLALPVMVAAGFVSARVYLSRTADGLTASGGAALGAMTWLWLYPLEAVGTVFELFTSQGHELVKNSLKAPELAQFLDDPRNFLIFVIAVLIVTLVIGGVSAALGGILAVRWQPRNGPSH